MYQKEKILSTTISVIGLMLAGYILLMFLPLIFTIGALCAIYAVIRFWLFQHQLKKSGYIFTYSSSEQEDKSNGTIIDAEYEIIDEKQHK